jgi:hypothetical protein
MLTEKFSSWIGRLKCLFGYHQFGEPVMTWVMLATGDNERVPVVHCKRCAVMRHERDHKTIYPGGLPHG